MHALQALILGHLLQIHIIFTDHAKIVMLDIIVLVEVMIRQYVLLVIIAQLALDISMSSLAQQE